MADTRVSAATSSNGAVSEESLLLAHLQRLEHAPAGCCAVLCHLSNLQAPYRKAHFVRIAARSFDTLTNHFDATLYVLANFDVALVCRNVRVEDIDTAIYKLRALFAEDPLAAEESADGADRFATWYDLSEWADLSELGEAIAGREAGLRQDQETAAAQPGAGTPPLAPLDATGLVQLEKRLQALRLTDVVRQQPTVDVRPDRGAASCSGALRGDGRASAADRAGHRLVRQPVAVSLHGRLPGQAHAGGDRAHEFRDPQGRHQPQPARRQRDVARVPGVRRADRRAHAKGGRRNPDGRHVAIGRLHQVRQRLRKRGYRLLVDGLFPMALQFFDPGLLEPDFIKINWSPDLGRDQRSRQRAELGDMIRYIGPDKFVLARAESEEAIRWGLNLGLHRFQGFFVDKLVDAMASKGLM